MILPPLLLKRLETLKGGAKSAALLGYQLGYQKKLSSLEKDAITWQKNQRIHYEHCLAELGELKDAILSESCC